MKELMKWIAKVLFYTVAVGLFVYAASRSLDFIQATLPASQKMVGYLGLLATGRRRGCMAGHVFVLCQRDRAKRTYPCCSW